MEKQAKIIAAVVLVMIVTVGGYYCYQKYSFNKRIHTSNKMMQDKDIKQNNTDKAIVDEILKNDTDLEYAYISHNDETIMLNLKFKKGIQDKDKYSKVSKYMEKIRAQYKGKNINATMIPN
ncbi:hypothetical protein [Clostridium kluyveri]|uniref:hypothetical protein n=1 Tax=Clostridium kluyveri TaxID=1534 RepID=UPI00224522D1|nr:hypothetical protein [Clostridium kluyveri]UZQ49415.1 hypothetical protein OP486_15855 [Clostridium kluyveri]